MGGYRAREEGGMNGEFGIDVMCTAMCKTDSLWEPAM